jgi:hypothetical protein
VGNVSNWQINPEKTQLRGKKKDSNWHSVLTPFTTIAFFLSVPESDANNQKHGKRSKTLKSIPNFFLFQTKKFRLKKIQQNVE